MFSNIKNLCFEKKNFYQVFGVNHRPPSYNCTGAIELNDFLGIYICETHQIRYLR